MSFFPRYLSQSQWQAPLRASPCASTRMARRSNPKAWLEAKPSEQVKAAAHSLDHFTSLLTFHPATSLTSTVTQDLKDYLYHEVLSRLSLYLKMLVQPAAHAKTNPTSTSVALNFLLPKITSFVKYLLSSMLLLTSILSHDARKSKCCAPL